MARARVLPLPDDQVRHILSRIDELTALFPSGANTRPFIAAFLQLVYDATGQVFGASTVRKLLQLYAPDYRPSTTTIQKEIELFRHQQSFSLNRHSGISSTEPYMATDHSPITAPPSSQHVEITALKALISGLQRTIETMPKPSATPTVDNTGLLAQAFESENKRLRLQLEQLTRRLEQGESGLQEAKKELATVKTERDTYLRINQEQLQRIEALSEAVKKAEERTHASHQFALQRIEDSRNELRQVQEKLQQAEKKNQALIKQVEDEKIMTENMRRALNSYRSRTES